jgi:hypothetical protein
MLAALSSLVSAEKRDDLTPIKPAPLTVKIERIPSTAKGINKALRTLTGTVRKALRSKAKRKPAAKRARKAVRS